MRRRFRLAPLALAVAAGIGALAGPAVPASAGTAVPALAGRAGLQEQYGATAEQNAVVYAAPAPLAPLVVLVHGGGWSGGTASRVSNVAADLAAQGFAVVNINYDLSTPQVAAFPMEPDEVESAVTWAVQHALELNADPANVTLLGGSAGGHLVATAALDLNRSVAGTVARVVTLSAPTDFPSLLSLARRGRITRESFRTNIYQALGCAPGTCTPTQTVPTSPSRNTAGPCARWLLMRGGGGAEFVPQNQVTVIAAALTQQGCQVTQALVPGGGHSFAYWPDVRDSVYAFVRSTS